MSSNLIAVQSIEEDRQADDNMETYIYVVGGRDRGKTLGVCERFSVTRLEWERGPLLLEPRGSHGAASFGGDVYAVAGGGMRSNLCSVEVLRDNAERWESVSPMMTPRHALSVVATNHFIFAIGGWMNGNCCSNDVERYDPIADSWSNCKPLLHARKLHGLVAFDGCIYAFGGAGHDESLLRSAECYSIEQDAWQSLPDLPMDAYATAAADASAIYVFLWGKYVVRFDPATRRYERRGPLPLPEWFGFAAATVGDDIYLLGGQTKGRRMGIAYRYRPALDAWEALPPMRMVRRRCAAAACRRARRPETPTEATAAASSQSSAGQQPPGAS